MTSISSVTLLITPLSVGQITTRPGNQTSNPTTNQPSPAGGNTPTNPLSVDELIRTVNSSSNTQGEDQSNRATQLINNVHRTGSAIERDMNALNQLLANEFGPGELTLNSDGSYSRSNNSGRYYWGPGFVYYTGGTATKRDGTTSNYQRSIRYTNGNGEWIAINEAPPFANALAGLNLIPNLESTGLTFYRPGAGNSGNYHLTPNGQIFFEGGMVDGVAAGAQTYVNGAWNPSLTTRPQGTLAISRMGLLPSHDGTWLHANSRARFTAQQLIQLENIGITTNEHGCFSIPGDSRYYFIREDGTIWTPGGGTLQNILPGRRFENGRWINDESPSGSAHQIAYANSHNHRLIPRPDGTFYDPNNADSIYIPQADGSWFMCQYDLTNPSSRTNSDWGPITLTRSAGSSTGWAWRGSRYPLSARHFMQVYGVREAENGTLRSPIYNGIFHRLPNDRLLFIRSSDNSHWVFSNGAWQRLATPIQPPNPPIR